MTIDRNCTTCRHRTEFKAKYWMYHMQRFSCFSIHLSWEYSSDGGACSVFNSAKCGKWVPATEELQLKVHIENLEEQLEKLKSENNMFYKKHCEVVAHANKLDAIRSILDGEEVRNEKTDV